MYIKLTSGAISDLGPARLVYSYRSGRVKVKLDCGVLILEAADTIQLRAACNAPLEHCLNEDPDLPNSESEE